MSDTLERVFRIHIPDSQTIVCVPTRNHDQPGVAIQECDWMQRVENEGWRWIGQRARNWYAEGRWQTEYLDVFRREAQNK